MSEERRLLLVRLAEAGGDEASAADLSQDALEAAVEVAEERNQLIQALVRLNGPAEHARCAGLTVERLRVRFRLLSTCQRVEVPSPTELRYQKRLEAWQPVGLPS